MGLRTFMLVYFQQLASNGLRNSFSFVQAQIIAFYHTNTVMFGLINTFFTFTIAIIFAYRAIYPYTQPVHTNFVNYTIIMIILLAIPFSMVIGINSFMVYTVLYLLFAILIGALPNVLIALLTRKYTTTENSFLMGLWAASYNLGNIFVSLLFTVMIFYLKIDWKWCLVVAPILVFIAALLLKIFEEELQPRQQNQQQSIGYNFRAIFSEADKVALFISIMGLSSSFYGMFFWVPMYLNQQGFEDFEGYINISFISFSIVGTLICKQIYSSNLSRRVQLSIHLVLMLVGILSLVIIYVSKLTPNQKWIFVGLIGLVGFCLGSLVSLYINHEIIILTEKNGQDVSMNMNMAHGLAELWTGLTQVITGAFSSISASSIFLLYVIFCLISLSAISCRIFLQYRKQRQPQAYNYDSVDSD